MKSKLLLLGLAGAASDCLDDCVYDTLRYNEIVNTTCHMADTATQASGLLMQADKPFKYPEKPEYDECTDLTVMNSVSKTYTDSKAAPDKVSQVDCDVKFVVDSGFVYLTYHVATVFTGNYSELESTLLQAQKRCQSFLDIVDENNKGIELFTEIYLPIICSLVVLGVVGAYLCIEKPCSKKEKTPRIEVVEDGVELEGLTVEADEKQHGRTQGAGKTKCCLFRLQAPKENNDTAEARRLTA